MDQCPREETTGNFKTIHWLVRVHGVRVFLSVVVVVRGATQRDHPGVRVPAATLSCPFHSKIILK